MKHCLFLISLFLSACWGQVPPGSPPPWSSPDSVEKVAQPDTLYPFLPGQPDRFFCAGHLLPFWTLLRDSSRKVRVLHVGDSHLQGDVQGREIRKRLYTLWGPGGRGYVFPFAIAGTNSGHDYTSKGAGQWIWARSVHTAPASTCK